MSVILGRDDILTDLVGLLTKQEEFPVSECDLWLWKLSNPFSLLSAEHRLIASSGDLCSTLCKGIKNTQCTAQIRHCFLL